MCGIVGVISAFSNGLSNDEAELFQDMLFFDTLRGWDSTGVFHVDNIGNVEINKEACHGPDFLITPQWKAQRAEAIRRGKFLVGHNRAATRGVINDVNAHPFVVDDELVLVHNGSYRGSHKDLADVDVDSHAIAIHLHKAGTTPEEISKALKEVDAAFTLVWYRVSTQTLHIIRNNERPLFIAKTTAGATMFASELEFILHAASRRKVKIDGKVEEVPVNTLFTFKMVNKGGLESKREVIDIAPNKKTVVSWPVSFPSHHSQNYHVMSRTTRGVHLQDNHNKGGIHDIRFSTQELLMAKTPSVHLAEKETMEVHHQLGEHVKYRNGRPLVVEPFDYFPANDHPNCATWFVCASPLGDPENDAATKAVVYWFVYNKSDVEIMDYCYDKFYTVNVTTTQIRFFLDRHNVRKGIVTGFGTNAHLFQIEQSKV